MTGNTISNFGRNVVFTPDVFLQPADENEVLQSLAAHRGKRIRVVGRLHSWSEAVRGDEVVLDLRKLDAVEIQRDGDGVSAILGAGTQIKRALAELQRENLTLPSIGLITEQTVAGAVCTGTHGSGRHSLSHYVEEVRVAVYDPVDGRPVVRTIRDGTELQAARCSLGCLGVMLSVRIRCREQFFVEEVCRRCETLDDVLAAEAEHPLQQFFLIPWSWTYFAQHRREIARPRSRSAGLYRAYWFLSIDVGLHVILLTLLRVFRLRAFVRGFYRWVLPRTVATNWRVVDRSDRQLVMEHELFRHIETELFVPRTRLPEMLAFLQEVLQVFDGNSAALSTGLRERLESIGLLSDLLEAAGSYTHHYPICIRRVQPDDASISASAGGGEDWYAVSCICYARPSGRDGFFRFAQLLAKGAASLFGARPHWGKHNPLDAGEVAKLYPRLDEFRAVCEAFDPDGAFRNDWIERLLFGREPRAGG